MPLHDVKHLAALRAASVAPLSHTWSWTNVHVSMPRSGLDLRDADALKGTSDVEVLEALKRIYEQPSILVYKEFKSCWTWKAKTL